MRRTWLTAAALLIALRVKVIRVLAAVTAGWMLGARSKETRTEPRPSRLKMAGGIFAALAVGGFLMAASGIIPIKASSGHWGITKWFLKFSMSRSVKTHSMGIRAPALDDPGLIVKGAAMYDVGCRPCHGAVMLPQPMMLDAMAPHPPFLPRIIPRWDPAELFYIVKHGVKFTGMPGWPALQRDDEVWAVVAFLLKLPGMERQEYEWLAGIAPPERAPGADALVSPETEPPIEICARCHGDDGMGRGVGVFPRLAGQRPIYLYNALRAFAIEARHSGVMEPLAGALGSDDMRRMALYYVDLNPGGGPVDKPPPGSVARGREIAVNGIPDRRIPSCIDCHGPGRSMRNPAYPNLSGQYADYIVLQLELFKSGRRGGSPYSHLMRPVAARLTLEQMRDVASYYASLSSER
jgi:cytochrome c553